MRRRSALRRALGDARGITIVEFAMVAPVMLLVMMALFDLTYRSYAQALLQGAVQKAGRDSAIEGASTTTAAIDQKVVDAVQQIATNSTWDSSRKSYTNFGAVAPEPFTDTAAPDPKHNGRYDVGECYSDINGNHQWDADPGNSGQGGANDVTVYSMTMHLPRLFPLAGMLGWPNTQDIVATTILKNQPYGTQAPSTPATICT